MLLPALPFMLSLHFTNGLPLCQDVTKWMMWREMLNMENINYRCIITKTGYQTGNLPAQQFKVMQPKKPIHGLPKTLSPITLQYKKNPVLQRYTLEVT